MTIDITKQILLDHHAHALRDDFRSVDSLGLRQSFSESRSLNIIEKHTANTINYLDFLSRIGELLDLSGEKQLLEVRDQMQAREYLNLLLDDASIAAFIIDDGYGPPNGMSLEKFGKVCERPVFRCTRIESVIEQSIIHSSSFEEVLGDFPSKLLAGVGKGAAITTIALKTVAAYRGGLDIDLASRSDAKSEYDRVKHALTQSDRPRIGRCALYHYLLAQAFELAQKYELPVQVHSGIGDQDENLILSNPAQMRNVLEDKRFSKTQFVFLHSYPYVRESAYLASIYANVYLDVSLVPFIASPTVESCFRDALASAPFTKILASTDGHSVPETFWFGAFSLRRGLSAALNQFATDNFITERQAEMIAASILHDNARNLYRFEGLK